MPFVTTQGARIHYAVAGHGPAVLLIQGVGLTGEGWRPQVDGLRDRFTLARELEPLFGHDLAEQPAIARTQLGATAAYDASDRLERLVSSRRWS